MDRDFCKNKSEIRENVWILRTNWQ